jgi:hypothetical protein
MLINTTLGMVDDSELQFEQIIEPMPCGHSVTRRWSKDGVVVRQDVEVAIVKGQQVGGITGIFGRAVEAGRKAAKKFDDENP